LIFLSSIFKKKNTYLGFEKFKRLSKMTKIRTIALGGINKKNINRLKLLNLFGFAGISHFIKKNGP
jgi:thiamine monophosphate synthase